MGILGPGGRGCAPVGGKGAVCRRLFFIVIALFVVTLYAAQAKGFELVAKESMAAPPGFSVEPLCNAGSGGVNGGKKGGGYAKVTLKSIPEKVVLLHFWATWCRACVEELPALEAMYKRYEKRGVRLLAVALDSKRRVRAYLKEHAVEIPVYLDPYGAVMRAYGVGVLPVTVVILQQADGARVAARFTGAKEWASPAGTAFMDRLLSVE